MLLLAHACTYNQDKPGQLFTHKQVTIGRAIGFRHWQQEVAQLFLYESQLNGILIFSCPIPEFATHYVFYFTDLWCVISCTMKKSSLLGKMKSLN